MLATIRSCTGVGGMNRDHIDPYDLLPKYGQLADIIRQKIERGEWAGEEPIPSERELEELYQVSRTTVRQALDVLVRRGYIYRDHGRGTFATPRKLQNSLQALTSFTQDMQRRGLTPGQKILSFGQVEVSAQVRQQLGLPPEVTRALRIERLRYADEEPIGIHDSYLALGQDQVIEQQELDQVGSLYKLLETRFGLVVAEADETIEATVADETEAALLAINSGEPLLLMKRTVQSQQYQVFEYARVLYRADRYQYSVHLSHE